MTTEELKYMAVKIKKKRIAMGFTQEHMAEQASISYSYYSKIENALHTPSLDVLIKIASILNLSLDKLIFQKDDSLEYSPETLELINRLKACDRSHLIECRDLLDCLIQFIE